MKDLLLEGGVAGHLMHLYDNPEMTFNKISKILHQASSGELEGTEKTDGFNIYLGAKDGQARAARNKGDMAKGGMTLDDLVAREFQGGEEVRKAYLDSFDAFQAAVSSLNPQEQENIFGSNGEIFYNTEIMGPGASNLLNYDTNVITIHHGGHKMYDAENNKLVVVDTEENSRALDRVIDRFEQATAEKSFSVQRTAVMSLESLDNDSHVKVALEKMKAAGFDGPMTIEEYLTSYIAPVVERKFPHLANETKEGIVNRILNKPGANLTQLTKGFPVEQKRDISSFIKENQKQLLSDGIWPIEKAIHDFAVKILEGLQSAYILDNEREVSRLKAEVEQAIKSIHSYSGPGSDEAMTVLYKQLQKLEHHDNITTPVEGFVFEYEGQLYKFTGNFAPINQILGLFKYGRGNVPPIQKDTSAKRDIREEEEEESTITVGGLNDRLKTIAIIPGAFKPPHRGHLDMVKYYSEIADEVTVLISKLSRETPRGKKITSEDSISIWNLYFDAAGIENARATASEHASPVRAAYEFVENAEPGIKIILGASTKGGDQSRFARDVQAYAKEGVVVLDPMMFAFDPVGEELSATDFRAALDEGLDISKFIPPNINPLAIYGVLNYDPSDMVPVQEEVGPSPIFFRMIEEIMEEHTEPIQKAWAAKHPSKKKRLIGKGGNTETGGGEGHERPNMERSKSAPPMEEQEELEETSLAGAVEGGGGGPWPGIEKEKDREDLTIRRSKPKKKTSMLKEDDLVDEIMDYLLKIGV